MRIQLVVDINHPADYHYYKNFIRRMMDKGFEVLITATKKDVSFDLLERSGLEFVNLGSYGNTLAQKVLNLPLIDYRMYRAVEKFDPDIFLGLGSIRAPHVSFALGKKSINFEDTEIAAQQMVLRVPFVNTIWTPSCFKGDMGRKHVRYDGYKELAYLHPKYFTPDKSVLDDIGQNEGEPFIVLRFVSWAATHDIGEYGLKNKLAYVRELEKYGRVLITSESPMDESLENYRVNIPPDKLHHLLYYATLYLGEGATMATEAAMLGTPSIYLSSIKEKLGYIGELRQKYGLLYSYDDQEAAMKKAIQLLRTPGIKEMWRKKRDRMLAEKIDVTAFMVWFVENYPASINLLKKDPVLQYKLKC